MSIMPVTVSNGFHKHLMEKSELLRYATKEECLLVLYAIYKAIEQDAKCAELPKKEEA